MDRIRADGAGMRPAPEPILRSMAAKLGLEPAAKLEAKKKETAPVPACPPATRQQ
jgi:hypothetical protein